MGDVLRIHQMKIDSESNIRMLEFHKHNMINILLVSTPVLSKLEACPVYFAHLLQPRIFRHRNQVLLQSVPISGHRKQNLKYS